MLSRMLEARLVFPTDGFSIRCCWWLVTGDTRQLTPDPGPVTTDGDRAAPSHHRDTQLGDTSTHNQCGGWVGCGVLRENCLVSNASGCFMLCPVLKPQFLVT